MKSKKRGFILASVFDKRGIAKFVKALNELGYKIISTEGTGKELAKNGITFVSAKKISKNPDKLNDCIQTISFQIEAGILFDRSNTIQVEEARTLDIKQIDMVICNFPPLEKVIKNPNADFNIRNVDVGGPLMVRAAATNFKHVLVVIDPNDYPRVTNAILEDKITSKFRQQLAIKAFRYTHSYDHSIINYLEKHNIFS
jgi:phosphoribosylaminoimidazolecarboxamide formyltransferase/IMP cyclohydrolase